VVVGDAVKLGQPGGSVFLSLDYVYVPAFVEESWTGRADT